MHTSSDICSIANCNIKSVALPEADWSPSEATLVSSASAPAPTPASASALLDSRHLLEHIASTDSYKTIIS
jgi:hypothetical protein